MISRRCPLDRFPSECCGWVTGPCGMSAAGSISSADLGWVNIAGAGCQCGRWIVLGKEVLSFVWETISCTSGTLAFFFYFFFSGYNRVGKSWVHLPYSVSGCLSETFEVGSRNQICFSQLRNGPSKEPYPCLIVHFLQS